MSKAATPTTETMRLITSNSDAIRKTPVEIWDEILKLATTVKNGDEYGELNTFDANFGYREMFFNCYVSPENQEYALATRRSVVKVCRAWHAIAIRFLWSHLIIHTDSWKFKAFYTIFLSPVELWLRVKRLDIVDAPEEDPKLQTVSDTRLKHLLTKIFPRLSNLQILCAPQNLAMVSLYPAGFIPFEYQSNGNTGMYEWAGGSHFWKSAQILDLNMDCAQLSEDSLEDGESILFLRLKKLRIRFPQDDSMFDQITKHWKTPVLEAFSLRDCYADHWVGLLVWSSNTVTTLELSAWYEHLEASTVVSMPRLRSIIVKKCFYKGWEKIIEAPNLMKLSFSDPDADYAYDNRREAFARILSRVIGHYPMCTSVSFFKKTEFWAIRPAHSQGDGCPSDPYHSGEAALPVFEFDPTNPHTRAVAVENQWLSPQL